MRHRVSIFITEDKQGCFSEMVWKFAEVRVAQYSLLSCVAHKQHKYSEIEARLSQIEMFIFINNWWCHGPVLLVCVCILEFSS